MAPTLRTAPSNIPVHRIDLSLPPRERYKSLALQYKESIATITPLFNQLLADLGVPVTRHGNVNTLARWLLRGVYSHIETAELRGISEVADVDMYLLVALNVVLDLLMGCTSSVVRSTSGTTLHLRTLDWGMDPLRQIIVQLDFFRSKGRDPNTVIARSITYVGFVGVLTGVRPGLSMSLNFRAVHNATNRWDHFRFYTHHLAVLLGFRQSISSILRQLLFAESSDSLEEAKALAMVEKSIAVEHSTAAYLVFSDGHQGMVVEKDFKTAHTRRDVHGFVIATNHDAQDSRQEKEATPTAAAAVKTARMEAMEELLEDSQERTECVAAKWRKHLEGVGRRGNAEVGISLQEAIRWVTDWPTTNETTHFAAVLDPANGTVQFARSYRQPVVEPTSRARRPRSIDDSG